MYLAHPIGWLTKAESICEKWLSEKKSQSSALTEESVANPDQVVMEGSTTDSYELVKTVIKTLGKPVVESLYKYPLEVSIIHLENEAPA